MNILTQTMTVTQDMQRHGAGDFLRRLASAVERHDANIEIESIQMTLRAEGCICFEEVFVHPV